jgi:hypothetical protein
MRPSDKGARRSLGEDASDAPDAEGEAHPLLIPARGGELEGEERPGAGLHVGKEEILPIEAPQGSLGGSRVVPVCGRHRPFPALASRLARRAGLSSSGTLCVPAQENIL